MVVTSGLLHRLQDQGLRDVVELEFTGRKALVQDYLIGWNRTYHGERPILIPQIAYLTNDSWEEVSCTAGASGYPLLHSAQYASGTLYVLTIPDNFSDLYCLPAEVLTHMRGLLMKDWSIYIEAPAQVALFAYDNDTFIMESFLPASTPVKLVCLEKFQPVYDVLSGECLVGEVVKDWRGASTGRLSYTLDLPPHSYRIFRLKMPAGSN